jgi:hypothetical protein
MSFQADALNINKRGPFRRAGTNIDSATFGIFSSMENQPRFSAGISF